MKARLRLHSRTREATDVDLIENVNPTALQELLGEARTVAGADP